jgi:hypothetical protein
MVAVVVKETPTPAALRDWAAARLATVPGFIEGATSVDDRPTGCTTTRSALMNSTSRFRAMLKSRQTGLSFVMAAEGLALGAPEARAHGDLRLLQPGRRHREDPPRRHALRVAAGQVEEAAGHRQQDLARVRGRQGPAHAPDLACPAASRGARARPTSTSTSCRSCATPEDLHGRRPDHQPRRRQPDARVHAAREGDLFYEIMEGEPEAVPDVPALPGGLVGLPRVLHRRDGRPAVAGP